METGVRMSIPPSITRAAEQVMRVMIVPLGPVLIVISSWSYFYDHRSIGALFLALFCAAGYGMWWAAELASKGERA
ncbi:hypothetical protein [Nocardia aurea]|jgi:hypothetical protein|uniref:hypothetical protein n=1 Tax=Nocardia aurea TaxID=2144174 RepID=UPI0033BC9A34